MIAMIIPPVTPAPVIDINMDWNGVQMIFGIALLARYAASFSAKEASRIGEATADSVCVPWIPNIQRILAKQQ